MQFSEPLMAEMNGIDQLLSLIYQAKSLFRMFFLQQNGIGFIVGASGLVLKTIDSGKSWTKIDFPSNDYLIKVFVTKEAVWIITNRNNVGKVYYSSDFGDSWQSISNINLPYVSSIYFINEKIGFIGGAGKIFKTTDGGKNWQTFEIKPTLSVSNFFFLSDSLGWLVGGSKDKYLFLRTSDQGVTWDTINFPISDYITSCYFLNDTVGFATTFTAKIYSTTDGGKSWDLDFANDAPYSMLAKVIFQGNVGWAIGNNNMVLKLDLTLSSVNEEKASVCNLVFSSSEVYIYNLSGNLVATVHIPNLWLEDMENYLKSELNLANGIYFIVPKRFAGKWGQRKILIIN